MDSISTSSDTCINIFYVLNHSDLAFRFLRAMTELVSSQWMYVGGALTAPLTLTCQCTGVPGRTGSHFSRRNQWFAVHRNKYTST